MIKRLAALALLTFVSSSLLFAQGDWIRTGTSLSAEKVRLAVPDFKAAGNDPNTAALLKTFNDWSGENLSSPRFRPLMVARGYKFTTSGVVWVHGLTLKPEFLGT